MRWVGFRYEALHGHGNFALGHGGRARRKLRCCLVGLLYVVTYYAELSMMSGRLIWRDKRALHSSILWKVSRSYYHLRQGFLLLLPLLLLLVSRVCQSNLFFFFLYCYACWLLYVSKPMALNRITCHPPSGNHPCIMSLPAQPCTQSFPFRRCFKP